MELAPAGIALFLRPMTVPNRLRPPRPLCFCIEGSAAVSNVNTTPGLCFLPSYLVPTEEVPLLSQIARSYHLHSISLGQGAARKRLD